MIARRYLRVDEAAAVLSCSPREIYRLMASGELRCFKIGEKKGLRIVADSLDAFIARRIEEYGAENGGFCDHGD